jgi:histone deacetylase complex regulatory component SIN3
VITASKTIKLNTMSYTAVPHLITEHEEWLIAADFYDNELDNLEESLAEVAGKNSSSDAMKSVEHFQNQFIIQRNTIDELRHSINEHVHKTLLDAKDHVGRVESKQVQEHKKIKDEFDSFKKVINELRDEFKIFLSKWM